MKWIKRRVKRFIHAYGLHTLVIGVAFVLVCFLVLRFALGWLAYN